MASHEMSLMETRAIQQHMATKITNDDVLCAFCAKIANKKCGRCGEFYCSVECQLCDWRNHRFICIPLPQLLPLNNSGNEHFSRLTSSRASLTSIGRIRRTAEKMIAAAPKDLVDSIDAEQDGISDMDIPDVARKCDEKSAMTDVKSNVKKLIVAVEEISMQPSSATATERSCVLEPEKQTRISRSKMLKAVETEAATAVSENPEAMQLPTNSNVIVVYVKDHKTVYVRQKPSSGEPDQHKQLIQKVIDSSIAAERLPSRPAVDEIVLAFSSAHSMYGRGSIQQIIGRSALIHFLEFGCSETVDAGNIKVLPDVLRHLPCLLNEITLAGVPVSALNPQKMVDYLSKLNLDQTLLKLKYSDGKVNRRSPWQICIEGELIDAATSTSVNQKMIELNVPAPLISVVSEVSLVSSASMDNLSSCENVAELPHKGFSGEKVNVLILDNSLMKLGYISCIREVDSALFGENDERVNVYGTQVAKDPPFVPNELGMACLVRSAEDHRWYRALFMQQGDKNMCEVAYIDYGNLETVNVSEIREINENLRFPCITVSCYIDGVTWMKRKLSKRLVDRLKALLPSYEKVTFDAIDYSDEEKVAIGKMQKMVKTLQDEQLI